MAEGLEQIRAVAQKLRIDVSKLLTTIEELNVLLVGPDALKVPSPTWELRELLAAGLVPSQIAALRLNDLLETGVADRIVIETRRCGRFKGQTIKADGRLAAAVFSLLRSRVGGGMHDFVVTNTDGTPMDARTIRYWAGKST